MKKQLGHKNLPVNFDREKEDIAKTLLGNNRFFFQRDGFGF